MSRIAHPRTIARPNASSALSALDFAHLFEQLIEAYVLELRSAPSLIIPWRVAQPTEKPNSGSRPKVLGEDLQRLVAKLVIGKSLDHVIHLPCILSGSSHESKRLVGLPALPTCRRRSEKRRTSMPLPSPDAVNPKVEFRPPRAFGPVLQFRRTGPGSCTRASDRPAPVRLAPSPGPRHFQQSMPKTKPFGRAPVRCAPTMTTPPLLHASRAVACSHQTDALARTYPGRAS